jgi:hypothetical protein
MEGLPLAGSKYLLCLARSLRFFKKVKKTYLGKLQVMSKTYIYLLMCEVHSLSADLLQ